MSDQAPEACPFCGAAKRHNAGFLWFLCGSMTAPNKEFRRYQTPACITAERERLTRDRDELRDRVKRLEKAGDHLARIAKPHSVGNSMLALAIHDWGIAKEAKP